MHSVIVQVGNLINGQFVPISEQPIPSHTDDFVRAGPALWAALHGRALTFKGEDDHAWLMMLASQIPASCCGEDWHKWCAAHPPRWDDYFAWTVEAHNAVNARLGKPIVTVEQARELWV